MTKLGSGTLRSFLLLLLTAVAATADSPSQVGSWATPIKWPIVGIHAAMAPTGEVLNLTYLEQGTELRTAATLWNPATGKFRDVSPGFGDMFCSGQAFLPTGELFIAGGYQGVSPGACNARGVSPVYTFNPANASWTKRGEMSYLRFYPSLVPLADGRQLIIGGQGDTCQYIPVMEIFDPATGLSKVNGPKVVMKDYPRAFLLSDGSVVHVAPEPTTRILSTSMKSWTTLAGTRLGRDRFEPAGFYVPGHQDRIMVCGGYTGGEAGDGDKEDPTATCEAIDPLAGNHAWQSKASMTFPRGDLNAVLLPDGKVLIVGGGELHRYDGPELSPELYDPATDSWTLMAPQTYGRMYHSTAVLLPDGRVLSAGQDDDGSGDGVVSGAWGEIFSPPYLFRGSRPGISSAPDSVDYGSEFRVTVSQTSSIRTVVLIGLSTVTHSHNTGQRYVPLSFTRAGSSLQVQMTENPNLAPPGFYMLFAVNDKGVPSQAHMILLTGADATSCFKLTRSHTGNGQEPAADPGMSPDCSEEDEFLAGTEIMLTAEPGSGKEVALWSGTDHDDSVLDTNVLTMPAANHSVSVKYDEIRTSFDDSFEDESFCTWSARECTDCEPVQCTSGAGGGGSGSPSDSAGITRLESSRKPSMDGQRNLTLIYEPSNKSRDYLIDRTPERGGGEARYEASFRIWPESGLTLKGTKTRILQAQQVVEAERPIFELFFNPVRGKKDTYALVAQGRADNGARVKLAPAEIDAGGWHYVRIVWEAGASDGSSDGSIALFVDDAAVDERSLHNASLRVDEARLGQVKGKKKPSRGVVYFDRFESSWLPAE